MARGVPFLYRDPGFVSLFLLVLSYPDACFTLSPVNSEVMLVGGIDPCYGVTGLLGKWGTVGSFKSRSGVETGDRVVSSTDG